MYIPFDDCVASGQHLKSCDDDGFCNSCGEQETKEEREMQKEYDELKDLLAESDFFETPKELAEAQARFYELEELLEI
jgi:hypothetical protein